MDHQHNRFIAWFAGNHVAANILMVMLVVGGAFAVMNTRTEVFPNIDPNLISVSVPYPGATPFEVVDGITSRVEDSLVGIDGIKRVSSTANEGFGSINIELEDFVNQQDVYKDVESAINALIDFPPASAEKPVIQQIKLNPNVLNLALHGDVDESTLKHWASTIESDIRMLPDVALTSIRGIRAYEIGIEVSEQNLRRYGLTLQSMANRISQFSIDLPAGSIESSEGDVLLRVQNKKVSKEGFENIPIKARLDGSVLKLSDVATIVDGFEDQNLISRYNGKSAAFIDVSRNSQADTLTVASQVKSYLKTLALPQGLTLSIQEDDTTILKDRISLMLRNALLGFMLVFLILLLFLDLKLAFWTSVAIPVSFLGGLMIMYGLGYSINMISLFALIVVLGIVVDDAIVAGESIFEEQQHNKTPSAVLTGMGSVIAPVTVGVSTTIAAFAPLSLSTGTFGQIIKVIPAVVISVLVVSLLEAYFILPSHLSKPTTWSVGVVAKIRDAFTRALETFTQDLLIPLSKCAMRWRYATIALFVGIAIITLGMIQGGVVRFIFFPKVEGDSVSVTVNMPDGTPFSRTKEVMLAVEKAAETVKQTLEADAKVFQSMALSIGETSSGQRPGRARRGNLGNHLGQLSIQLLPSDQRDVSADDVERSLRKEIGVIPDAQSIAFKSSRIGGGEDIDIELSSESDVELEAATKALKEDIQSIAGSIEVSDTFKRGKQEYVFALSDEGRALGLSPSDLGRHLRAAYFGIEIQRFQKQGEETVVYVRYPKEERKQLSSLNESRIRLPDGSEVPLSRVSDISKQVAYAQIQSVNGRRVVNVKSKVDYAINTPSKVLEQLQKVGLPSLKKRFPGIRYGVEGESKEQQSDLKTLAKNMVMALLIIYILLGAQLRSYVQPLVIMSAIPFGLVGATWGHYALGHDLSFISMFGMVALSGVVVNDSVVLMDYLNQKRGEGMSLFDSAVAAIKRRFRPILLTTLTTSLGLMPMLLETSMQARFLIPMVISLATGIVFATVIILLLIPCMVLVIQDVQRLPSRLMRKFL